MDRESEGRAAAAADPGETKLVDACREHDLKPSEVEGWMETFLKDGERSFKVRSEQAVYEHELRRL